MKELVVISGKGGTGKTSVTASLAWLARPVVVADCDVDAADLHLLLSPTVERTEDFSGGKRARIDPEACSRCGECIRRCRFEAVLQGADGKAPTVDPIACEGCGVCAWFCPSDAVAFEPAVNGRWFSSRARTGPMVHAELGVAEENSGKLVSTVRQAARGQAERKGLELVLIDGSPGIGCPVIASITGADGVLIVTEPTVSGLHDLERAGQLAGHFGIPAMVCVNKWDINPDQAQRIEDHARAEGMAVVGRIRYDRAVTDAQLLRRSVVEVAADGIAADLRELWAAVRERLER